MARLAFLTSTPLDVARGSGTYSGITTLARALESLGHEVRIIAPARRLRVYTLERLLFNEALRRMRLDEFDAVAGFDLDGWRVAARHVAAIKGVIADELRFERGATRWTMSVQALCERAHARRAAAVITTSVYAARRIRELYGREAEIVPECIDVDAWTARLSPNAALPDPGRFTVLCVCRFYPRKRVGVLLDAAARLRRRVPELEVRIAGGGPEEARLIAQARALKLDECVRWLGTISDDELAGEYSRADVFCLPSVQEGFGIVFLEAMAAGKPIVAARAAAVPEVVRSAGLLVEPDSAEALAFALERLWREPRLREELSAGGRRDVVAYDAPRIARRFLEATRKALGGVTAASS